MRVCVLQYGAVRQGQHTASHLQHQGKKICPFGNARRVALALQCVAHNSQKSALCASEWFAVCCSVLQCLAEHCSGCGVLQCLGEYCSGGSVFQNVSLGLTQFGLLQCVAVCSLDNARHLNNAQKSSLLACRSVLQCVAVAASCSELQ